MEKLDGKPLDWQAAGAQQKEKIMHYLVNMFREMLYASMASPISQYSEERDPSAYSLPHLREHKLYSTPTSQ